LTLGDLYLEHTTSQDKGIEHYQTALKHAQNSLEKGRVHLALGYVLENKASYQEALSQFEQAYRLDVEGAKGELLLSMARCYQQLKNNAKAISIYDQISKDLKNTEYAKIAEQKKKHLN
jgi:tetratricopeptide (TPR) repeat protein